MGIPRSIQLMLTLPSNVIGVLLSQTVVMIKIDQVMRAAEVLPITCQRDFGRQALRHL
jgi:hypothetical protein